MHTSDDSNFSTLEAWKLSRSGAWAGRGFHYQHLLSTLILIRQWAGLAPAGHLVPEGLEDCVVELADRNIWLQIKSRKDGAFSDTKVEEILTDTRAKVAAVKGVKSNHAAVVLERPRTGRSEAGIDQIFNCDNPLIFFCADPGEEGLKLLSTKLDTPEVIASGIVSDLYMLVAEASQKNASLPFEKRRRISTTEIECRIFERLEAEDPSAIDRAMASGVLEPVDFGRSISEPAFYQGVKVRPGHVAAGLVFTRPDDSNSVIRALRRRRHVLISGPSGAGKSALMWQCAHLLAGEFRWYQVTARAITADATAIVRFVRARRPSDGSPIGLAFDDVGSASTGLWDVLVRELRGLPSVYILGSVRQEDFALITDQSDTEFIAVRLDEKLAETVWQKLHASEQTAWAHWREPFEQSEGLMLEYVHLLTQGRRFLTVIDEQIRQRQQEERHNELAIIRITAVLCSLGAEVQTRKLLALLDMTPDDGAAALTRLIDEHLVKESRPGVLGGLHRLRSRALSEASHDAAAFLSVDSVWKGLEAVTSDTIPRTIQSIFSETAGQEEATALKSLAKVLGDSSEIDVWVAILTGLGLATLDRRVASFIEILDLHGVQRAHWSLASMFSDSDIDVPELADLEQWKALRDSVLAFRNFPKKDLRLACLEHLPKESVVPSCQNLQQANRFLSCLAPISGGEPVTLTIAPDFVSNRQHDIRQVAALLSTAYLVGPDVARDLVQAFGGEQVLFELFLSQTPWVTTPSVDANGKHGRTVRSDWFYVAEQEQPDAHESVCSNCETLIALSPDSDAAASDAVNPQGQPILVGDHRPWSKNMPRRNIPAKTRIAWNVAFRQILLAKSATATLTDYTQQMAELVKRTERVFRSFTEKWIKAKSIQNVGVRAEEISEIVHAVNALTYATPANLEPEMSAPTQGAGDDDSLGALLNGVLGNLLPRMNLIPQEGEIKGAAIFAGSLAAQAREHEQSAIWRTCAEPPLCELRKLEGRLLDVSCILHEMAADSNGSSVFRLTRVARRSSLGKAVSVAARHSCLSADQRFHKRLRALESSLKERGWNARCWSRPIDEADHVHWPAREVTILVRIADFETDAGYIEDSLAMGQDLLGTDWRFRVAPVINGYVLPALALLSSSPVPLPDQNFTKDWRDHIDHPFLLPEILDRFDEALTACAQLSGILACRDPEGLHPEEHEVFLRSVELFKRNRDHVAEAAETTGAEHLALACNYLNESWHQVVHELESAKAGQPVAEPVCMNAHLALAGETSEYTTDLAAVRILMLQAECSKAAENADISPTGAS